MAPKTDVIEQLRERVRELEEENARLKFALADTEALELGTSERLAAAQEEIKTVTEQKNRMWFEMQTAQDQLAKAEQRVAEYNELIYAVQTKHHDLETANKDAYKALLECEALKKLKEVQQ